MKTTYLPLLVLGVFFATAADRAWAQYQYQQPYTRPAISPYLQILRQGASPAENYYNLTRPQLAFDQGIYSLQNQTMQNRNSINSLENQQLQTYTTGHPSGFMTYSRYFQNNGSGAPNLSSRNAGLGTPGNRLSSGGGATGGVGAPR